MSKPVYEFLLWENCKNNCIFCHQKNKYHPLQFQQQIRSIEKVKEFISSEKFISDSHILIVGGELFDSKPVFEYMKSLFDFIVDNMKSNKIDLFYINTNLIYKDLSCVYYLLDLIKANNMFDRLKFTSSYDYAGRFANNASEKLMLDNLTKIKKDYPECHIVVNTMLTNKSCELIINKDISILEFSQKYDVYVNLIPYIILGDSLTATRSQIFSALKVVDMEIPGYLDYYINNMDINQSKHLYSYDVINDCLKYVSCALGDCGHSINFKRYSAKGGCYICDLKKVFSTLIQ